jgi:hypothetical protein
MLAVDPAEAERDSAEKDNNQLADAGDHAEVVFFQQMAEASLGMEGCLEAEFAFNLRAGRG